MKCIFQNVSIQCISNTAGEPSMHKILPPGQHQAHLGGSLNGSHGDHQHQYQHHIDKNTNINNKLTITRSQYM